MQGARPDARSRLRIRVFSLIVALIPVTFFAALEGALRVGGYGDSYPLFLESIDQRGYRMPNPDVIQRYFAEGRAPAVSIETNYFLVEKPARGLRIFVQGGSSAAGFPIGFQASIAGMLGYRLKQSFPDRPVEVIDTGLSAVNSYTLRDFADEIVAERPDAVLIYAGHNEFVGILGVGTAYAIADSHLLTLTQVHLRHLRTFQLLRNLQARLQQMVHEPLELEATTLMAAVARDSEIGLGSDRYQRGIDAFRRNMTALIDRYRAAGVPVFIATVSSNLADQPPFLSHALPPLVESEMQPVFAAVADGRYEEIADQALERLEAVAAAFESAEAYHAAARVHAYRGEFARALSFYTLARDHDLLRFRAPSDINDVIRGLASAPGVTLVDVNGQLASRARNGILGYELMLEHLHPTVDGYFEIADSFYAALQSSGVFGEFPQPVVADDARKEIPVLPAQEFFSRAAIADLLADYPFVEAPQPPALPPVRSAADSLGLAYYRGDIDWLTLAEESRRLFANDPVRRAMTSQLIADARPSRTDLSLRAGLDWLAAARPEAATRYLLLAVEQDPDNVDYLLALMRAYLERQRRADAVSWAESILDLSPGHPEALAVVQQAAE